MKKTCAICGKEFEPRRSKDIFCYDDHYANCPVCDKPYLMKRYAYGKPPVCCSYECRTVKRTQTSLERYGCRAPGNNPEARRKASETMMKNLGVPYAMMSEAVHQKAIDTLKSRYGVDNIGKSPKHKMQAVKTAIQRYGKLPFNLQESYDKQHRTIQERYGVNSALEIPHVQQSSTTRVSKLNLETKDRIEKLGYECQLEYNIQGNYYDLRVVDTPFLIELNPTWTHYLYASKGSNCYNKYYHRNRSVLAESAGLMCIHVWDWDNFTKVLGSVFKLTTMDAYDDGFRVYKLSEDIANSFLSNNDLRGAVKEKALHLGLVKNNEVYQCISFIKPKYNQKYDYQLVRYTQKLYVDIVGGFDLLSSQASCYFGISNCIAYMDYSKPYNQKYLEEMGMKYKYRVPPALVYSKGQKFYTQSLVDSHYNTVDSIGKDTGWFPIYTCGSKVFTFD